MSGLLSSAYPWGDSNSQSTKKRTPSLSISRNKTIKRSANLVKENTFHSDDNYGDFKPLNSSNLHAYIDDTESIASFPHKPDSRLSDIKDKDYQMSSSTSGIVPFSDVNDVPYAHIDIAGVADNNKSIGYTQKGGAGYGVQLSVEIARQLAE